MSDRYPCLQRPGRDLSTFKANVLDKLATRVWYLHNSADGRLFFKNQQNLAAKLRATAQSLHAETLAHLGSAGSGYSPNGVQALIPTGYRCRHWGPLG